MERQEVRQFRSLPYNATNAANHGEPALMTFYIPN